MESLTKKNTQIAGSSSNNKPEHLSVLIGMEKRRSGNYNESGNIKPSVNQILLESSPLVTPRFRSPDSPDRTYFLTPRSYKFRLLKTSDGKKDSEEDFFARPVEYSQSPEPKKFRSKADINKKLQEFQQKSLEKDLLSTVSSEKKSPILKLAKKINNGFYEIDNPPLYLFFYSDEEKNSAISKKKYKKLIKIENHENFQDEGLKNEDFNICFFIKYNNYLSRKIESPLKSKEEAIDLKKLNQNSENEYKRFNFSLDRNKVDVKKSNEQFKSSDFNEEEAVEDKIKQLIKDSCKKVGFNIDNKSDQELIKAIMSIAAKHHGVANAKDAFKESLEEMYHSNRAELKKDNLRLPTVNVNNKYFKNQEEIFKDLCEILVNKDPHKRVREGIIEELYKKAKKLSKEFQKAAEKFGIMTGNDNIGSRFVGMRLCRAANPDIINSLFEKNPSNAVSGPKFIFKMQEKQQEEHLAI